MERDIFICHASEDKANVVRPLYLGLQAQNIACWIDEGEIQWGDSITQIVNEGLRTSSFLIVVLSQSFIEKNWPKRELFAALNQEASSGEIKVLPLLVGDKVAREKIIEELPLLNDKKYLVWDGQPQPIVDAILARISRSRNEVSVIPTSVHSSDFGRDIPLPKIRKNFTQRDRDLFLKESFTLIKEYFKLALPKLQTQYPEIETDFSEIHATKFIAKIYYLGNVKNQCKIWIGGLSKSDGISYLENQFNIDMDNLFNEIIMIEDDGVNLKLKSTINITSPSQSKAFLNPSEAAEMLWLRFSASLEHM